MCMNSPMVKNSQLCVWVRNHISFWRNQGVFANDSLKRPENRFGICPQRHRQYFTFMTPLGGVHHVSIREHRTATD